MSHPDFYDGLLDWPLHGPKDGEIVDLVLELADKGLRLAEIECRIKQKFGPGSSRSKLQGQQLPFRAHRAKTCLEGRRSI